MPAFSAKRIVKLLLRLLIICVIAAVVAYLIFTAKRISDKNIPLNDFGGKIYCTKDGATVLTFSGTAGSATFSRNGVKYSLKTEYSDGVLKLGQGQNVFIFIVTDSDSLFSDSGYFLYLYR